ncbi:acyltransferase family protein [[Clostridium] fimetarium]|uniref:Acyltransferase family protein n=1 Tax=[Clostridium] fimetarium TaxID=99656 RepID=A0A1I0RG08_9FIRM|nr:acyltransferase [[Clostridium] fimetarium]SEW39805.1 Acyltransferase family protein [[Clostridium] fimetarium]
MINIDIFQERDCIYIMKAIALYSVVSAHVGIISNNTFFGILFSLILSSIGSIGVGIFFLISGYLFLNTNKTTTQFLSAKVSTIIIPWIFCGTLLFFYVALRKGGVNIYNWVSTLMVHSHLYYLTILMIFYLLFWKLKNNLCFLLFNMFLSIISIVLTGLDLIPIYPYINPFNWSIYFILGLLIKKYHLLEKLVLFCKKWFLCITSIYFLFLIIYLINGVSISYWKYASFIAELVAMAFVFGASYFCLMLKKANWLVDIGKISFSLYLLHMPIAGIITNLFNRFELWYFTLFIPIIVIIITIAGIQTFRFISRKIKVNKIFDILIGYR